MTVEYEIEEIVMQTGGREGMLEEANKTSDFEARKLIQSILEQSKDGQSIYQIFWLGTNEDPIDLKIEGYKVAAAKQGNLFTKEGIHIGTYFPINDNEAHLRGEHMIFVFIFQNKTID